jgi:hypothetical protein
MNFGRALRNPDRNNDAVYDEVNNELNGLKDYIVNNDIDDQDRKAISAVMEELEEDLENATEEDSESNIFSTIIQKIKSFWREHKPVEKVNE